MKAEMTAQLVADALVMVIWRRGKPDALLCSIIPIKAAGAEGRDPPDLCGGRAMDDVPDVITPHPLSMARLHRGPQQRWDEGSTKDYINA
jgi:hypothetical protein